MEFGSGRRTPDTSQLAVLAGRQHGMVSMAQLQMLGFSRWAVARRVEAGYLHRLHRGVYAVGHAKLTLRGRWMAAVLACGSGAVLSHTDAAALWGIRHVPSGLIEVTARGKRSVDGVRCHVGRVAPVDRATIDGIPVTGLDRTVCDLAPRLSGQRLRTLLEHVQRRDLLDYGRLRARVEALRGRPGMPRLAAALDALDDEAPWTQSRLERRFLELIRGARLPGPSCNVLIEGELVDFAWPVQRLIVETDGYGFHRSRRSFEDDRRRDARLLAAGWRTVRVTTRRLEHEADPFTDELRRMLGR